jgi:nicotinate-nucleotide adenylyltransferase
MNIALFGTSADPPTVGHQQILLWLAQRFDRVVVWAADNPFKHHGTSLEQRVRMLQLLIQEIQDLEPSSSQDLHQSIGVYPELADRRTIHTVERAREHWPQATFTLVVGSDLISQLPQWYRAKDLLQQANVLIVPRPGSPIEPTALQTLQETGAKISISEIKGLSVSSTAYRELHRIDAITPLVQAYIHQEKLYPCPDQPPASLSLV